MQLLKQSRNKLTETPHMATQTLDLRSGYYLVFFAPSTAIMVLRDITSQTPQVIIL